jgi:Zn-dependent protease/CBS domain-containing protein
MGRGIKLGKIAGISIEINYTWFIIFGLVAVTYSNGFFSRYFPADNRGLMWVFGIATAILLFASIVAHELCHAIFARRRGVETTSVTLFVFGGVARMTDEPRTPGAEFEIAAAGPACSFALAILFAALEVWAQVLRLNEATVKVFGLAWSLNLLLGIFNLLPGLPLDGGRLFRALVWWRTSSITRATRAASTAGQVLGYGLIGLGIVGLLFQEFIGGLWFIFIGWFLSSTAAASYRQVQAQKALEGVPVSKLMTAPVTVVPADATIHDLVQGYFLQHAYSAYPVVDAESVRGVINVSDVRDFPRDRWQLTTVGEITPPLSERQTVSPDADGWEALAKMAQGGSPCLLVMEDGRLLGIVSHSDILRLIRARLQLGV